MTLKVAIVRSFQSNEAIVRVQSDAIARGLPTIGVEPAKLYLPHQFTQQSYSHSDVVLFHYSDALALQALRTLQQSGCKGGLAICLGSDIESFDDYVSAHNVADIFTCPTHLHGAVLRSQIHKPVFELAEGIDPIAGSDQAPRLNLRPKGRSLLWFGYPRSFYRGVTPLVSAIKHALKSGIIDRFCIITDKYSFDNSGGFEVKDFNEARFLIDSSDFIYALLSHFSSDLALNSYIKSENKLVSALWAGLLPIASDTPSYRKLLGSHGLDACLFDSPVQFVERLRHLDPIADRQRVLASGVYADLARSRTDACIARKLLNIIQEFERTRVDLAPSASEIAIYKPPVPAFSFYARQLWPSGKRAVRTRISRIAKSINKLPK